MTSLVDNTVVAGDNVLLRCDLSRPELRGERLLQPTNRCRPLILRLFLRPAAAPKPDHFKREYSGREGREPRRKEREPGKAVPGGTIRIRHPAISSFGRLALSRRGWEITL
jgi:hypothetical protein